MKKRVIAVIVVAVFALSIGAIAQVSRTNAKTGVKAKAETRTCGRRGVVAEKLGLTQEQKQQIAEIVKGYFAEIKPILKSDISREEKTAQIEPIRTRAIESIMAVLTPEQQATAREMGLADRMLRPMKHHHGVRMMHVLSRLNLTDQQKSTIKGIFESARQEAKTIKDDTTLTPEQRKTQFQDLKSSTREQVMSVLTAEQRQQFREMIQQCKKRGSQDGWAKKNHPASQKARVK